MSKVLVIIKSMGIGDLSILISSIHAISKKIAKPVTVLAQENTRASAILKHDPYIKEVIELNKNEIKENFHYKFFSKKGKNFFKTAKEFTEKTLNIEINSQSKIYWDNNDIEKAKKNYDITNNTKNIICGISASGPTKCWDINNYIRLFEELNKKYKSKFFLAGGSNDEELIKKVINSNVGKNCISFSKMKLSEAIPIIGASQYYIGNDTGWGHIASALGLKSLFLFMDSPPLAYGVYSKNIEIVCPEGFTIENTGHNTRGKDRISFDKVLKKSSEMINLNF